MCQQFRTCPIWSRALGPLLMNSFPCKRKKLQPPLLPRFFTLPRPQGLGGLRVPEDGWLLFLVSSHGVRAPALLRKSGHSKAAWHITNIFIWVCNCSIFTKRVEFPHLFYSSNGDQDPDLLKPWPLGNASSAGKRPRQPLRKC